MEAFLGPPETSGQPSYYHTECHCHDFRVTLTAQSHLQEPEQTCLLGHFEHKWWLVTCATVLLPQDSLVLPSLVTSDQVKRKLGIAVTQQFV